MPGTGPLARGGPTTWGPAEPRPGPRGWWSRASGIGEEHPLRGHGGWRGLTRSSDSRQRVPSQSPCTALGRTPRGPPSRSLSGSVCLRSETHPGSSHHVPGQPRGPQAEWAREAPGHDHGAAQQTRGTHCSPSLGRTRGDSHMPCCSPLRPERPAHCPSHCSSLHSRRRGDSWRSVAASPANAVSQPGCFQKGPPPQRRWEWRCHGNEAAVSGLALTEQVYPDIQ